VTLTEFGHMFIIGLVKQYARYRKEIHSYRLLFRRFCPLSIDIIILKEQYMLRKESLTEI